MNQETLRSPVNPTISQVVQTALHVHSEQLSDELAHLATFSSHPAPAVTRVLYSPEDVAARRFIRDLCLAAGLTLREDPLGNVFARWPGSDPRLTPVVSGSHIDAIPNAGAYDGTVGVLGALEAIRTLQRSGFQPQRSVEVLLFTSEEPTRFGVGCLGSRALCGALTPEQLRDLRDSDGQTLDELRHQAGCSGDLAAVAIPPGSIHAFVELHIEQGPILEQKNLPIGIVHAIAAPASLRVDITGVGGHAGAVLMPERHDALLTGAEIALAVEQAVLTTNSPNTVGTTGVFLVEPGAINSIPNRVVLEIDVRDVSLAARDAALNAIQSAIETISARRGTPTQLTVLNADPPATCHPTLVRHAEAACAHLGLQYELMVSRAYHDSLFMARLCPTIMLFIPCRNGYSHRPDEYASPDAIRTGVQVLAQTLAQLACV